MNASSWSLRNLPWFKATLAQWRYALRNTIAMCLALTVAYYLNLDEPYWAMTSAAVVSFPTVGGVISKSLGRIAGSLLGAIAALLLAGHTLNEPWFFLLSMSAWLGFCTWACAHHHKLAASDLFQQVIDVTAVAFTEDNGRTDDG